MTVDVRRALLKYLGERRGPALQPALTLWRTSTSRWGCSETEAWEPLWAFVGDGLIYLDPAGQGSSTDNWSWRVSADGERAVKGGTWEPRDPEGYLARIRREIPDLDGLVELYLTEALQSSNGRCYLATSVILGVAAEQAFLVMASRMPPRRWLARPLSPRRSRSHAATTSPSGWNSAGASSPFARNLPGGLADALTLDAIADLIRLTRNEAGHPTGRQIDEDTARVHLTIAPVYLRKMQLLSVHFAGTPAGASA